MFDFSNYLTKSKDYDNSNKKPQKVWIEMLLQQ